MLREFCSVLVSSTRAEPDLANQRKCVDQLAKGLRPCYPRWNARSVARVEMACAGAPAPPSDTVWLDGVDRKKLAKNASGAGKAESFHPLNLRNFLDPIPSPLAAKASSCKKTTPQPSHDPGGIRLRHLNQLKPNDRSNLDRNGERDAWIVAVNSSTDAPLAPSQLSFLRNESFACQRKQPGTAELRKDS
jgi:hypothetical protein